MSGFTPPTRLIDYFFVIQVLDSINSEEPLKTLTYHSYPPVVDRESALRNITPFCFPGSGNSLKDHNVLFHDFVLTDERGLKRYAVCVRTKNVEIVADTDVNTTDNVINCFAVVSNQPRFNTLRACLTELLLRIQSGEGPEKFIWSLVHEVCAVVWLLISVNSFLSKGYFTSFRACFIDYLSAWYQPKVVVGFAKFEENAAVDGFLARSHDSFTRLAQCGVCVLFTIVGKIHSVPFEITDVSRSVL